MAPFDKITESSSQYDHLEQMSVNEILSNINKEDQKVAKAVQECIPSISKLVEEIVPRFERGGRLFYIGAGTSGRLGILDASEIPPTFGYPHDRVVGLIAGGDSAIRKAVEFAEDNPKGAENDLGEFNLNKNDVLIGIAASGTTPYVVGGIEFANSKGALTAAITNNPGSPISKAAQLAIEIVVGPEFVTGSTRMKSGTSQKLVLNMISSALMIRIGRVKGNKMVDMQLNNQKLIKRGIKFLVQELSISSNEAADLLDRYKSVRRVLNQYQKD
jgi:N-acetylmuramic acid 6-phosphate etherase